MCSTREAAAHVGADGLGVPGPDQAVRAAQQLRGQPPQALPAHQHHRQRPRPHCGVHRQLDPRRGCLGCGPKVCGAYIVSHSCCQDSVHDMSFSCTSNHFSPTESFRYHVTCGVCSRCSQASFTRKPTRAMLCAPLTLGVRGWAQAGKMLAWPVGCQRQRRVRQGSYRDHRRVGVTQHPRRGCRSEPCQGLLPQQLYWAAAAAGPHAPQRRRQRPASCWTHRMDCTANSLIGAPHRSALFAGQ